MRGKDTIPEHAQNFLREYGLAKRISYRFLPICANKGFHEDLARQNIVARLFQRQLGFRRRHAWAFSHRRSVLRPLFRMPHGLLGYQRSSALFRPVCLSITFLSI